MIKDLIKQFFCSHNDISIETSTEIRAGLSGIFIVKTFIKCNKCKKAFTQHPNANCCYVQHLHSEILKEEYLTISSRYIQQGLQK